MKEGDSMKIGFIGAGRMGFTLGKYLCENGYEVAGYYSRNTEHAREAAGFTETLCYKDLDSLVKACDTLFLTVNDSNISAVYEELCRYDIKGKIICHTSGALSSEVFTDSLKHGVYGYSVHPIYAVNSKYDSHKNFKKAFITIEGNEKYSDEVRNIFIKAGNETAVIDKNCKSKYHAASVCASNLVCGLYEMSVNMLCECGFSYEAAITAINGLFIGNAENICKVGAVNALTGPLERGDTQTVSKHLNALEGNKKEVYRALSREVLHLAEKKNKEKDYSEIEKIL